MDHRYHPPVSTEGFHGITTTKSTHMTHPESRERKRADRTQKKTEPT